MASLEAVEAAANFLVGAVSGNVTILFIRNIVHIESAKAVHIRLCMRGSQRRNEPAGSC
jgi:hypothetical protein